MNTFQIGSANPRAYRFSGWSRGLFLLVGGVLVVISLPAVFALRPGSNASPALLLTAVPFLIGAYLLIYAIRSRLIIDGARIEVRGAFSERTADRSELLGFRTVRIRNGSYTKLYMKDGTNGITIPQNFSTDDDFRAWFAQITDLDERDKQTILDEISQEQALGTTPDERLAALTSAKTWSISLCAAAIAAAAVLYFSKFPLSLAATVVLALIPLTAIYLAQQSPLLYAFFKQKADPRADFGFAVLASSFGLFLSSIGKSYVSYQPLLWMAVPIAIAVFAALCLSSRNLFALPQTMIGYLVLCAFYGFGLASASNTIPDQSTPVPYRVQVVGKHVSHGRSTSYHLDLAPWGPIDHANSITVPHQIYSGIGLGSRVCVELHPGIINAPWYQRVDCGDSNEWNR